MATGYYLLDNPPARSQYRTPRREKPSGVIVIHTAESPADQTGPDAGAENVAAFIRRRSDPGSYHALSDSDSTLKLVPWSYEAWQDGTGSNPHAIGLSVACQAAAWPTLPQSWRDGAINGLAALARDAAAWLESEHGVIVPARIISRAESEQRKPGFIAHGTPVGRDPARRSDPGIHFPWDQFLTAFAQEEEVPQPAVTVDSKGRTWRFVKGTNNTLWGQREDEGWKDYGGGLTSGPAAVAKGSNLIVVVRGNKTPDNQHHTYECTIDSESKERVGGWRDKGGNS